MPISIDTQYISPDRLSDVIRLIIVLSVDKNSFRTEEGLEGILRDLPRSGKTWLEIAKDHPEFFRLNIDGTHVVLLLRFSQETYVADGEKRQTLTLDQTQKLIDQAIALHDRQLARYQRDSYKTGLWGAIIVAIGSFLTSLFTLYYSSQEANDLKVGIATIKTELHALYILNTKTNLTESPKQQFNNSPIEKPTVKK